MKSNLLLVVFVIFVFASVSATEEDLSENERHKRTIGVLFRGLMNAFNTPVPQPPPKVTSFQPQRPTKQKKKSRPQQDNVSPEKTGLQNALTTPTAPFQLPILEEPTTSAPKENDQNFQAPPPNSQSSAVNGAQEISPNPLFVPQNPFSDMIPPPGHHPLMPFKAQIFFIPFQNFQDSSIPAKISDLEPLNPKSTPQMNYQAEIYLHSPPNSVYPPTENYSGRYSPSNGWHDVDEILKRSNQKVKDRLKEGPLVENLTYPGYQYLNYQNLEGLSPKSDSKLGVTRTDPPATDNSAIPRRRIDHYQNQQYIDASSYTPFPQDSQEVVNHDYFGYSYENLQTEEIPQSQYFHYSQNNDPHYHQHDLNKYTSRDHEFFPQRQTPSEYISNEQERNNNQRRNDNAEPSLENTNYNRPLGYELYPTKIGRVPNFLL